MTPIKKEVFTDIDIDVKDRKEILRHFNYTTAIERVTDNGDYIMHRSGVYFDSIPKDPIENVATIPYKDAEKLGYQKIDFLNVHVYDDISSRDDLEESI